MLKSLSLFQSKFKKIRICKQQTKIRLLSTLFQNISREKPVFSYFVIKISIPQNFERCFSFNFCQNTQQYGLAEQVSQISDVVYHDHKLFIFEKMQQTEFQAFLPPFCSNFPYFFPNQLSNFSNGMAYNMENLAVCQFYPMWEQFNQAQPQSESPIEKDDNDVIVDQTQAGSRSSQIIQKSKRTQAPRFRPTKNNQSNISNQAFSFVTTESKSKNVLQNFLKSKKKTELFYDYSKCLASKRKKYMSKGTLLKLCNLTQNPTELQGINKLKAFNILSLSEFESGIRFLIIYFLKHKSASSILTSQKIASNLKKDHIMKVREILNYIEDSFAGQRQKMGVCQQSLQIKLEC